jgi:ketosteroid isomerase-like protein
VSQENLNAIEGAYEAVSRLDAEALIAVCEPDVEFQSRVAEAEGVTYRGHDGVRDYIASLSEVFESVQTDALEVIDGGDRAVVCSSPRIQGRRGGVETEGQFFQALRFRNGKVRWWAFYPSKAEALEAVGLRE